MDLKNISFEVLDELVYDAATGTGSMAVDMLEGAFSFVSGEIAKTGPDAMEVKTPVAVIGIRGTTVAGKAAVEGNENSFTLLQDADGGVGQIAVSNDGGTQVLAQVGATTSISSFTAPPPPPVILTTAQIQANYGTALNVLPPTHIELSLHKDWLDNYGKDLMKKQYFKYKNVDFKEIANSSRR